MNNTNYTRQVTLEEEMRGLGVVKYLKSLTEAKEKGTESTLPPGKALLKESVEKVALGVAEWIESTRSGQARRHASIADKVDLFEPETVAFLALRRVINGISGQSSITITAMDIAGYLHDELEYRKFAKEAPGIAKWAAEDTKKKPSEAVKRRTVLFRKRKAGIEDTVWAAEDKLRIGLRLIEIIEETCGIIERVTILDARKKSRTFLSGTPTIREWLATAHKSCELMSPVWLPMVCPPRPWTAPRTGGYLTANIKVIKTTNKHYLEELAHRDISQVYSALNGLQETPWRINKGLYNVMKHTWDTLEGGRAGLPPKSGLPMPHKPLDIETNEDARKEYRTNARIVVEENVMNVSKVAATVQKLWVAERFLEEEALYFPHVMDWRGRSYPVPTFVSPQGDDAGRALLEFADGKALGHDGVAWLAVHVSNTWGNDKVPFDERITWVQDNEMDILGYAMDPYVNTGWTAADSPWCFLAACMDWLGYTRDGGAHVSHIPVQMDGTCNGLQNFSAMLRDEVGGAAVNLVPSDTPSDIYRTVAIESSRMIALDAAAGKVEAIALEGKITRKLTKTNTMTLPYGVSTWGMRDQVVQDFKKYTKSGELDIGDADLYRCSNYLGDINYKAIGTVVVSAKLAMDWLQAAARLVASNGLPITWTSPIGLPVLQDYRRVIAKRVNFGAGGLQKFTLSITGDDLDARKQAAGISPNFVHSCDASHMMLTIVTAKANGLGHFSFIHDSFGCHAADMPTLSTVLRKCFVDIYREDVLGKFRDELIHQLGDSPKALELAPLPPMGTLDLEGVNDSEYFFA